MWSQRVWPSMHALAAIEKFTPEQTLRLAGHMGSTWGKTPRKIGSDPRLMGTLGLTPGSLGLTPVEGAWIESSAVGAAFRGGDSEACWQQGRNLRCTAGGAKRFGGLRRELSAHRSRILRLQHKRDENSSFGAHCERGCPASIFEARSVVGLKDQSARILGNNGRMTSPGVTTNS